MKAPDAEGALTNTTEKGLRVAGEQEGGGSVYLMLMNFLCQGDRNNASL